MEQPSIINTRELIKTPAIPPAASFRPVYSAEPQSGSLLDYWHAIARRKLSLAIFGVVGLGIGLGVAMVQAPAFRASTSIEIQDEKDSASRILNPQQQPDSASPDIFTDIQTQIKILQSHSLIEKALEKTEISSVADLEHRPEGSTAPWSGLLLKIHPSSSETGHEDLVKRAAKDLKVTAVAQTRIVEVTFDAADPMLAARMTNALTAEYIEQNLQARWQMNRKTSEWLAGQVGEFRGKLQQSEDALQAYARQKGLLYTGAGDNQMVSEAKLRELQSELSKAEADRMEKQSRFEIARSAAPGSVPEVMNDANLRMMEGNLVDLRKQEAEMAVTFKPDYSKAKALHAEIDSLEAAIGNKRGAIVIRLNNELQESQRREQLLSGAYAQQTHLVAGDSEKSIQYDMLKHEVDTNRQIYQLMLQRVKESSIASALKATNVRIIDPAHAPEHPYKPQVPLNAGLGLLAGLLLGVCGIVIRSKADGTLQEPGDAGTLLGLPELGVIPSITSAKNSNLQLTAAMTQTPQVADSFRAVLASIIFAGTRKNQRVLVLTSASPSEGKTTTTSNLAVTLANMGRRVLLIDGDIRSPRVHSTLGIENSTGLTTMLKEIGLNQTPSGNYVKESSIPNLDVLTSGPAIQAGADLLFSTSMPALIARFRNEYDMVLIDTAPMLIMPDARVLGRLADAVVLVARAGKTTRSALQAACQRFAEDQTPILGVVLNDWNPKLSAYKYYAAYKESSVDLIAEPKPAGAQ